MTATATPMADQAVAQNGSALVRINDSGLVTRRNATSRSVVTPITGTNRFVKLVGNSIDFGGAFFVEADEEPLTWGTLSFRNDGTTIEPWLVGYLHFYDALGVTARMQMRYFDAAGNELTTRVSDEHTATSNGHERVDISMAPFADPTIHRVNVSTTIEAAGNWFTVTAQNYYLYDLGPATEDVQLHEIDIDFGGYGFDGTSTTSPGELAWNVGPNGTIRPHLTGYLHLNQARGVRARMQIDYLDYFGVQIARHVGGTVEAETSGHRRWRVDQDPFESPAIHQVRVYTTIELADGWSVVRSKLFTI